MKKILSISLMFFAVFAAAIITAQEQEKAGSGILKVSVDGFKNDKGSAMIGLCNSQDCYKKKNSDKPFMGTMIPIKEGKAEWIISDLAYGSYTISVYHDENSNAKLDTNLLGVPKERYGFSNNARGVFGPPKYEEVLFAFDKAEMTVNITVK
jgi:uncharacterized protein (DUF2141 family)